MKIKRTKEVVIRKEQTCWGCEDKFAPGSTLYVVVSKDHKEEYSSSYWCAACRERVESSNGVEYNWIKQGELKVKS